MHSCKRLLATAVFAGTMLCAAGNAIAAPIIVDAVGDAFSVDWAGSSSPNGLPVSADSDWVVTSYTPTSVTFDVAITNTSGTSPASLTGFGFNTNLPVLSGVETSAIWEQVSVGENNFDVCVENDKNDNCFGNSGNPAYGIAVGATDSFSLTLNFASTAEGIILSDFFARLQGIGPNGDSAKLTADAVPGDPLTAVPEPATLSLIGVGLAATAARRRWKR